MAAGAVSEVAWPTERFMAEEVHFFNGEAVEFLHQPAAQTDGTASCSSAVRM